MLFRALQLLSLAAATLCFPTTKETRTTSYVKRNLHTIRSIYNLTVYPNNVPILTKGASAVPPGLFSSDATGRVDPLGNFTGFDDSIEYFFGLSPTPQPNPTGVAVYEAEVVEFTSGCADIASSVVYLKAGIVDAQTAQPIPGGNTTILKQIAFWRFDENGLVLQYDAYIANLQLWTVTATGIDYSQRPIQEGAISRQICPQILQRCTGENEQYPDTTTCIADLSQKPFGSFDEVWGDNDVCRIIHLLLTPIRPEVHCPHVGPKGGSAPNNYKCVDINFNEPSYYTNDQQLFGGEKFFCTKYVS